MVAKSRAEIQRAYRQRLKEKNNEEYLKKERERRKKTYIPSAQLSRRERLRRNIENNIHLRRHRQRKADAKKAADQNQTPLIVALPFNNKAKGSRKRVSRALARQNKKMKKIESTLSELRKKYKSALRKIQRAKKAMNKMTPDTPNSKTNAQLAEANLDDDQVLKIRRQLLLGNVVLEEVKEAKKQNTRSKSKVLHNTVAGMIIKKYRCMSLLSKKTGLGRRALSSARSKSLDYQTEMRRRSVHRYQEAVISFMERDDNSRNLPGKADKVKISDKSTQQKRVFTDYLANLHQKFLAENPTAQLSLTSFQRIRPKYILNTSFISRSSCLCTKHQNMALILKSLHRKGLDVPKNPEEFVSKEASLEDIADALTCTEVVYSQWKRVTIEDKGQKKIITKIVEVHKTKEDFMHHLNDQHSEFKAHVTRMKNQYAQIRALKQSLPPNHAVIHMDFAENYNCKSVEEVQSAYWSQSFVTLHPAVIYTGVNGAHHNSYVYISDDLNHNSTAVITFVKDLVGKVKEINPDTECIHYWTDSPTSQYRNKTIFYLIANHHQLFQVRAQWNYFEAGHGKGPCDGIGGCTKRNADLAMKSGKCIIQDAQDFYTWTQSDACNIRNIHFVYISKEKCEETSKEVNEWKTKAVKGTMKIHGVIGKRDAVVLVRDTSCYCSDCLQGNLCDGWRREVIHEKQKQTENVTERGERVDEDKEQTGGTDQPKEKEQTEEKEQTYQVGDYVAALYEHELYLGKVIDTDMDDELCYNISFLEKKKAQYQWPRRPDKIWIRKNDIKFDIMEPIPSGKSRKILKISPEDRRKLENYDH